MSGGQYAGFRLALAGLALFFFGLGLGFAVTAYPEAKPLLAAHEAALGSGTFLISVGAIWSLYLTSASRLLVPAVWLSQYALTITIAMDGFAGMHKIAGPLIGLSCIAVTLTTLLLIAMFWRALRSMPQAA